MSSTRLAAKLGKAKFDPDRLEQLGRGGRYQSERGGVSGH